MLPGGSADGVTGTPRNILPWETDGMSGNLRPALLALAVLGMMPGCLAELDRQAKEKSKGNIVGKTTQDIGKFDADAGEKVSDSKIRVTNPVTGPLEAYGPMVEQISKTHIKHALELYRAEHGSYPKDYDEFMEEIIRKNNIKLPKLPFGKRYQYDEQNHELVVVDAPAGEANGDAAAAPADGGDG